MSHQIPGNCKTWWNYKVMSHHHTTWWNFTIWWNYNAWIYWIVFHGSTYQHNMVKLQSMNILNWVPRFHIPAYLSQKPSFIHYFCRLPLNLGLFESWVLDLNTGVNHWCSKIGYQIERKCIVWWFITLISWVLSTHYRVLFIGETFCKNQR